MPSKEKQTKITNEQILDELISLLDRMGIVVKYDRGNFQGGLVKYQDNDYFYINRKAETETKINTILEEIKNLDIPSNLISNEIKMLLENDKAEKPE
ncbi:MAG: hypothetical protein P8X42_09130 [Calditrichaceae bacterium]